MSWVTRPDPILGGHMVQKYMYSTTACTMMFPDQRNGYLAINDYV